MAMKFTGGGVPDEPRMNPTELEDLLVYIIRESTIYSQARMHIQPDDWDPHSERHYRILIDCLFKLGDSKLYKIGDIHYVAVHNAIRNVMDDDPMLRDAPHLINDIVGRPIDADPYNGLLYHAYKVVDQADLNRAYGLTLLKRFLRERQVLDKVRQKIDGAGGRNVIGFGSFLRNITIKDRAVEAIGSDPFHDMLPDNWAPTTIEMTPIGIPWADDLMGGQAPGDVNGILGPFGGGKTMLAIQGAVTRAKLCTAWHESGEPGHERLRRVIYASYEEDVERDSRPRALAFAALIKKDRLESLRHPEQQLSRKGNLLEYEEDMYAEMKITDPALMDGEYERLMKAKAQVGKSLKMMDMKNAGRGSGWIPELVSYIEQGQQEHDWLIDTVIIDYTKLMCRRHLKALDKDPDRHLRHLINETPMAAKIELAERFGCTVWLLQQLSGEANTRSPTAPLNHAHAGEARDFAENLVNCLVLGVKDGETGCCRVFYTKGRRSEKQGTATLIFLDGGFARTMSAANSHTIAHGKIVQSHLYQQIHGEPTQTVTIGAPVAMWQPNMGTEGDE
jgi:hypothetical protein